MNVLLAAVHHHCNPISTKDNAKGKPVKTCENGVKTGEKGGGGVNHSRSQIGGTSIIPVTKQQCSSHAAPQNRGLCCQNMKTCTMRTSASFTNLVDILALYHMLLQILSFCFWNLLWQLQL